MIAKYSRFNEFFLPEEKKAILQYLRELVAEVYTANSIYPEVYEEAVERRIHQDLALSKLHLINQELQFVIDTLPVSIKEYFNLCPLVEKGINQIKRWRKSDNERLKKLEEKEIVLLKGRIKALRTEASLLPSGQVLANSTNFCNVNGNGNANCNNASNSNGVRPILRNSHDEMFLQEGGPVHP